GTRLVMTGSLLLLGLGAFATALVHELWQLYLTYGVIVSLAAGGPAPVSIAAIAARWFAARRGLVVGIGTAGISAGQLLLVPVAMWLTVMLDWRASYIALAALLCLVTAPLVWLLLRDDPADRGLAPFGAEQPSVVGSSGRAQPAPERSPLRAPRRRLPQRPVLAALRQLFHLRLHHPRPDRHPHRTVRHRARHRRDVRRQRAGPHGRSEHPGRHRRRLRRGSLRPARPAGAH